LKSVYYVTKYTVYNLVGIGGVKLPGYEWSGAVRLDYY
jgi:hypothetical protein